jgi:hypothetical protein
MANLAGVWRTLLVPMCLRLHRDGENWRLRGSHRVAPFVVIPAKAGIQRPWRAKDTGSRVATPRSGLQGMQSRRNDEPHPVIPGLTRNPALAPNKLLDSGLRRDDVYQVRSNNIPI